MTVSTAQDPQAFAGAISRHLAGRYFDRSTTTGTRVRGYRRTSTGFSVTKAGAYGSPAAIVEWNVATFTKDAGEVIARRTDQLAAELTRAGYTVERLPVQGITRRLRVTR